MGSIRDIAEQLWQGQSARTALDPFTPRMGLEEVADGVAFVSTFGNVCAIRSHEGLVLIDTGTFFVAPAVRDAIRAFSADRVHRIIYTHGHIDHVTGALLFGEEAREKGWEKPAVIAHASVPLRFDRYLLTGGYNGCINSRQFQAPVAWPKRFWYPDTTYDSRLDLTIGGQTIELHHARGETDDHTWIWMPERKALFTGDLFIWVFPNAGNPQKVQRYPREWAAALREMAKRDAEVLCPGHGFPIFGAARVREALTDTAEALESLVDQTLERLNAGARLDEILHSVKVPERLLDKPYLTPLYDEPEFVIRNLWRLYGGWHDGNPAHLKPGPERALAEEIANLAGGPAKLADRAQALAAAGELALACHLIEMAAQAAPGDAAIWSMRAEVYRRRSASESSLMARGIFAAAAEEALRG
jgi:alkyl sulfatase BDS1-like metallo-beta-lactamase superfamily hydrolase